MSRGRRAVDGARSPWLRVARAGVFAVGGALLGIGAHRFGGGMRPPTWSMGVALIALFVLAWAFTGRERGTRALIALVVGTQALLHLGFAAVGMAGMDGMTDGSLLDQVLCRRAGHAPTPADLAAARDTAQRLGLDVTAGRAPSGGLLMHESLLMIACHLVAAVLLAWWLARGERVAWRCARRVIETIRAVTDGVTALPGCAGAVVRTAVRRTPVPQWYSAAPGRAPPAPPFRVPHAAAA